MPIAIRRRTTLGAGLGVATLALTGSIAASFQSGAWMFCFVILVSGVFWLANRWIGQIQSR